MADDYGILITAPGVDTTNAPTSQVVMNTSNPFIKIDTQNPKGFQSILLLITTDPTEGVYTTVYSFAHGYKYVPSLETLFYVSAAPPATLAYQTYFQDSGFLAVQSFVNNYVLLYAVADATNVYIIVDKSHSTANLLTGTNVQITTHVFVEDVPSSV